MPKCWTCDEQIHFDDDVRSPSGKMIPIGENDSPHQCPNKEPYSGSSSRGGGPDAVDILGLSYSVEKIEKSISKIEANLLKLVLSVQAVQMKLEGQKTLDGA